MSARKKEQIINDLSIEAIGSEGVAIGRFNDIVCFVKGAVPGDIVDAKVKRKKKKYFECKIERINNFSKDRVEPQCEHFGVCGGCSWQHLNYDNQLYWKRKIIEDNFARIGKIEISEFNPYLTTDRIYNYRNKMEFSYSANRWLTEDEIASEIVFSDKNYALGLHLPGRFDKVLNINVCHLQQNDANIILNEVRKWGYDNGLDAYHVTRHNGFLRHLTIRYSLYQDTYMVILTTNTSENGNNAILINELFIKLKELVPNIISFVHAINTSKNAVMIDNYKVMGGEEYSVEDILGIKYRISPFSFFQTNSFMLNDFIKTIVDSAQIEHRDIVWDLYCGTGSITLPASKYAKHIYGLELSEQSIEDAKSNAKYNNLDNCTFISKDLHAKDSRLVFNDLPKPDIIIIDPPRAGIQQNVIDIILESDARRVVYVSCNPSTQARDCSLLSQKYQVKSVTPVDMFPHTYHIESIAVMELKNE